jgi:alkanesulfonate monooxygenase SsuD/methylene tetrahydromethanopterin reductase-like flavin-dependent oxidoreductase (luciferase family)
VVCMGCVRIGVKPGQWGWTFEELVEAWAAAEEVGFDLLSCFDHVSSAPAGLRAWDASTLLAAMAGSTERIGIGVHVLNASLRHPFLLAGQLAVAQAVSRGRLEVGLGAGSSHLAQRDHQALGIPFPSHEDRIEQLRTMSDVLPALWRGESVTNELLGLTGASLGPIGIRVPRLVIGGTSMTVLEIAARHADAWNAPEPEPERYRELVRAMSTVLDRSDRVRPLERQVQLFVADTGIDGLKDRLGRFEDLDVDTVVIVLHEEHGRDAVLRLSDAVLG